MTDPLAAATERTLAELARVQAERDRLQVELLAAHETIERMRLTDFQCMQLSTMKDRTEDISIHRLIDRLTKAAR